MPFAPGAVHVITITLPVDATASTVPYADVPRSELQRARELERLRRMVSSFKLSHAVARRPGWWHDLPQRRGPRPVWPKHHRKMSRVPRHEASRCLRGRGRGRTQTA